MVVQGILTLRVIHTTVHDPARVEIRKLTTQPCGICAGGGHPTPLNSHMVASSTSVWYRRVWWGPSVMTAAACVLIAVAIDTPEQEGILLAAAIPGALPWSLALLLMDPAAGYAERAGLLVAVGLALNIAAIWG